MIDLSFCHCIIISPIVNIFWHTSKKPKKKDIKQNASPEQSAYRVMDKYRHCGNNNKKKPISKKKGTKQEAFSKEKETEGPILL